jgi:hypothetical protein
MAQALPQRTLVRLPPRTCCITAIARKPGSVRHHKEENPEAFAGHTPLAPPAWTSSMRQALCQTKSLRWPGTGSATTCLNDQRLVPIVTKRSAEELGPRYSEGAVMRTAYRSPQCTDRLVGQYPRISPGNRAPFWPTACGAECPDPTVFRTSSANCRRSSKRRGSSRVGSWWDARKYSSTSVANLWRSSIRSLSQHSCLQRASGAYERIRRHELHGSPLVAVRCNLPRCIWGRRTGSWKSGSTRSGNRYRT